MKVFFLAIISIALLQGCMSKNSVVVQTDNQFKDCTDCPQMVKIPSGNFLMGAEGGEKGRPEGPVHKVSVKAFALGAYEVTHGEFSKFVVATGYKPSANCRVWPKSHMDSNSNYNWENPGYQFLPANNYPVACVSWVDAKAYVSWLSEITNLSYRLPSESEWEYAARAGNEADYFWGDDPELGCKYANMNDKSSEVNGFRWANSKCDDGFPQVSPVGSFPANAFGVYDVAGNVWEWTEDCYILFYKGAPTDGSAHVSANNCDRRSVRGVSWMTRPDRNRSSFRGRDPVNTLYFMFGFRVARDLGDAEL